MASMTDDCALMEKEGIKVKLLEGDYTNIKITYDYDEEIANGAVFLVSDMGRAVLGDIMYMTGGAALLSYEDMNYNIF